MEVQIPHVSGFVGHTVSVKTTLLCRCGSKAAIDKTCMNVHGSVLVKLYLWTLSFELPTMFMCHETLFFNHLREM